MPEVSVEKSIEINASADKVWDLMLQIESWPEWIPVVKSAARVKGEPLSPGSKLRFSPKLGLISLPLTVTVIASRAPGHLAWKGGGPGLSAVHSFDLEEKEGKTLLISRETFSGLAVPLFKLAVSRKDLEELHVKWIEGLKRAAEK